MLTLIKTSFSVTRATRKLINENKNKFVQNLTKSLLNLISGVLHIHSIIVYLYAAFHMGRIENCIKSSTVFTDTVCLKFKHPKKSISIRFSNISSLHNYVSSWLAGRLCIKPMPDYETITTFALQEPNHSRISIVLLCKWMLWLLCLRIPTS